MAIEQITSPEIITAGAVSIVLALAKVLDHFKGKGREANLHKHFRHLEESLKKDVGDLRDDVRQDVQEVRDDVRELRFICVGPDGQNGLRGDMRDLSKAVQEMERRERERLERVIGQFNPKPS